MLLTGCNDRIAKEESATWNISVLYVQSHMQRFVHFKSWKNDGD